MRIAIVVAIIFVVPLWIFVAARDDGACRTHQHLEDRENQVWIDSHRVLYGCKDCAAKRVYFDGALVLDWGYWTAEEIKSTVPATQRPCTMP